LLLNDSTSITAQLVCRDAGALLAGCAWFEQTFTRLDTDCVVHWLSDEGATLAANQVIATITGNARAMLTAERTGMNFLQTLSAVATNTADYVRAIIGTRTKILDTRKTIPGLRLAQKYAVRVGGGCNQRLALYDGILIKENHIMAAGSITAALQHAFALVQSRNLTISVQIEVESMPELIEALNAGAKSILLDNFSLSEMQQAVAINANQYAAQALLEASGGASLETVRAIAETGVDRISIGKLTKDITAVDFSLRVVGNLQ
jgi:nicotinate-nucleotide pyrophosphorylase (carboxylating)